jgi:hypothetical protein
MEYFARRASEIRAVAAPALLSALTGMAGFSNIRGPPASSLSGRPAIPFVACRAILLAQAFDGP